MIDYRLFEVLTLIESMLDKQSYYLTDAAKCGKMKKLEITFDAVKDNHGVTTKLQHGVNIHWAS